MAAASDPRNEGERERESLDCRRKVSCCMFPKDAQDLNLVKQDRGYLKIFIPKQLIFNTIHKNYKARKNQLHVNVRKIVM